MKTLKEQILNKCVHFTGIMNTCCKAGVRYLDVRIYVPGQLAGLPCMKTGGECPKAKFPTEQEAEEEEKQVLWEGQKVLLARVSIMKKIEESGKDKGTVPCECGGVVTFVSASNGHVRAACNKCKMAFME